MSYERDLILSTVEDKQVGLIRLWFTDVLGRLKSIAISPSELEQALADGVRFDGSAINGFARVQESDVLAKPDPTTFELLPRRENEVLSARMFCDILHLDGSVFPGDPRQVLRRALKRAAELGYEFSCGPEVEFFYFRTDGTGGASGLNPAGAGGSGSGGGTADGGIGIGHGVGTNALMSELGSEAQPVPLDQASYFDLTPGNISGRLRQRTLQVLEEMGISVEYSFHEEGPGQNEIDLRYTDALTMADHLITLRYVVKRVAGYENVKASFMPKPLSGAQGSGLHTHLSLFQGDRNAFFEPGGGGAGADEGGNGMGISKVGQQFVAGLLRHAKEITAVTNQLINSYKRFARGDEAPCYVAWAHNNRSALIRVPRGTSSKSESTRIEYRALDSATNPYLAFALLLEAGLAGIAGDYELPEEADVDLSSLDFEVARDHNLQSLPMSLNEALLEMEQSELVAQVLGDHIFNWFLRNKRAEWAEYQQQITSFEFQKYFDW